MGIEERVGNGRRGTPCRARLIAWGSTALFSLLSGVVDGPQAHGQEVVVQFFQNSFLPQTVTVERGGTVNFVWRRGVHTVTSGLPGGEAGTPDEPGALFEIELNEQNSSFSYTFDFGQRDGLAFFDRENPGQIGFISIDSGEITVRVGVVDNVFLPDRVFIFAGDAVRWEHEPREAFHTVTSGLSSRPEDNPGALFDEESSDARPIFVYRFAEAASYPYFCRPHEALAMNGIVHVQKNFLRGDSTGDGRVDMTDPLVTLNTLFAAGEGTSCYDAMDANDDGQVDISDALFILLFLFNGGPPLPDPFPVKGADRTEDTLYCWP